MWRKSVVIFLVTMLSVVSIGRGQSYQVLLTLDLKLAEGSELPEYSDLMGIAGSISHRAASGSTIQRREAKSIVWADPNNRSAVLRLELTVGSDQGFKEAEYYEFQRVVADQLKKLATSDGDVKPEQRKARLQEINKQIGVLSTKGQAVQTLLDARGDSAEMIRRRLEQLRTSLQQLDMQMTAKQARRAALQDGVNRQRKQAEAQGQDDAIARELRKLVELREEAMARSKQLRDQGLVAQAEASEPEAKLAEAKIRLAEREAELAKGGKGDVLERMSDELAMVSVDLLELDIQLSRVRDQLNRYNLSVNNPKQLDELLSQEPQLGGGDAAALYALQEDLRKQSIQLQRERFALIVEDVTLQEPPKQQ
jgi:chromosome segregation ATPase